MARSRISILLLAASGCAVASSGDTVRMQMGEWNLACSKVTATYQPNHVIVQNAVLTQGPNSIKADKAESAAMDVKEATWYLSGHVQVQVPQGEMASDTATVTFHQGKIVIAQAHGSPATFLQHALAPLPAASGHATDVYFDVAKSEVRLNGDAFVTREHNDLTACQVVYNIAQQTVDAQKCDNATDGIHGSIELKQQPTPAPAPTPGTPK